MIVTNEWPRELYGGWLSLDFANTLDARGMAATEENLHTYQDFLNWASYAGVLDDEEAPKLARLALSKPADAMDVLATALDLREAIYRTCYAASRGQLSSRTAAGRKDLAILQAAYAESMRRARLVVDGYETSWQWDANDLSRVWWPIATSAIELLQAGPTDRIKVCASDEGCAGLFLDMSKNRSRRWCDMKSCGIDFKIRRQNERRRAARGNS